MKSIKIFLRARRLPVILLSLFAILTLSTNASGQNATNKNARRIDKSKLMIHENMRDAAMQHIGNHHKMINHPSTRPKAIHHVKKALRTRHIIRKTPIKKPTRPKAERLIHNSHKASFHRHR